MPGKGNPFLKVRVPRKYLLAVKLEAQKAGITVSEHVRRILKEHFERVWDTQTSGVGHLEKLTHVAKQYVATVRLSRQTTEPRMKSDEGSGLPGAPRHDELEELVWKAIREAVDYSETVDAAKNALARFKVLRVANSLMRIELSILTHQDDAFVDDLLEELAQGAGELEEETVKRTAERAG